ncbi:MAG: Flp family type IVb pilin [Desulfatirhabdiaceae bacterium]
MNRLSHQIYCFLSSEDGASAAEYAILASLIAAVIALTVDILGKQVSEFFVKVNWWN